MHYSEIPDAQLEAHFNPRVATDGVDAKIATMVQRSRATRAALEHIADVRYGDRPGEALDIFPAAEDHAPVLVFVHGGYWRAMDKSDYSFVAAPFVNAGATVVVINYDLCPSVSLETIVDETMQSIRWTFQSINAYRGDPRRLYLAGNSAGGHLVALAAAHDWAKEDVDPEAIKGVFPITGVFDCEPVVKTSINEVVGLTVDRARTLSPIHQPPQLNVPMIVSVGGSEPAAWVRMSRDYMMMCESRGLNCAYMELEGMDHFDISATLGDVDSPLTQAILKTMNLSSD